MGKRNFLSVKVVTSLLLVITRFKKAKEGNLGCTWAGLNLKCALQRFLVFAGVVAVSECFVPLTIKCRRRRSKSMYCDWTDHYVVNPSTLFRYCLTNNWISERHHNLWFIFYISNIPNKLLTSLDEVEQNIVICQWRTDQLFAEAES